jgi:hypothetical protein
MSKRCEQEVQVSRVRTLASLKQPDGTWPPARIMLTWLPKSLKVTNKCCYISIVASFFVVTATYVSHSYLDSKHLKYISQLFDDFQVFNNPVFAIFGRGPHPQVLVLRFTAGFCDNPFGIIESYVGDAGLRGNNTDPGKY